MADDNKPMKYARYAGGEIILVVIGILIALQINNWNEERKDRMVEIKYLKNLKHDLQNDSVALVNIRENRINTIKAVKSLLNIAASKEIESVFEVDSLYWTIGIWWEFIPNDNTFQELISSGKLNIIKNEKIKNYLLKLSKDNEQIVVDRNHMRREYDQYLYDQMVPAISFLETKDLNQINDMWESWFYSNRAIINENQDLLSEQYRELLSNSTFINGLALAGGNSQYLISEYDQMLLDISALIELINKDLNKHKP
jgi:flagellar biosynthesis regulator FlaF